MFGSMLLSGGGGDSYTKLLLHADGAGASFVDNSASAHTITANGGATQSATQSKFGGKSAFLNGSSDYLSSANNTDWNIGTNDFTLEAWINTNSTGGVQRIISRGEVEGSVAASGDWSFGFYNTSFNFASNQGGVHDYSSTAFTAIQTGTWYHCAVTRASGTLYFFLNGVLYGTATDNDSLTSSTPIYVGARWRSGSAVEFVNGYLDEIRFSNGIARWTANFTPPTQPYS